MYFLFVLAPVLVDEETRMSANGNLDLGVDEDSQSSTGTNSKREVRRYRCEVIVPERYGKIKNIKTSICCLIA